MIVQSRGYYSNNESTVCLDSTSETILQSKGWHCMKYLLKQRFMKLSELKSVMKFSKRL